MINNLFSIFDPSTSFNFNLNWLSLCIWIVIAPFSFWASSSIFLISWKSLLKKFFQEIRNNIKLSKIKNCLIISSIFIFILLRNIIGLFPYVFTSSSHLVFTIFFAFPFWITFILFSLINKFNIVIAHLVPIGSPITLRFFIVIIETVRNIIRPITLSVRLTANIIRGHLLIHLLSSISIFRNLLFILRIPFITILLILETAVAFIQGFVFVILISLYINER